jgi:hypothetical protein
MKRKNVFTELFVFGFVLSLVFSMMACDLYSNNDPTPGLDGTWRAGNGAWYRFTGDEFEYSHPALVGRIKGTFQVQFSNISFTATHVWSNTQNDWLETDNFAHWHRHFRDSEPVRLEFSLVNNRWGFRIDNSIRFIRE